ncbi:receptor-type tyrosine-protein phosphatase T-like isoform X2 [Mytilus californianus]|uniref:receptor-type tyrosine-protein phosphatase T-like isoform X2 n=1 Tax=Mytilus californianus TaxID=6549 RepID=UPI0022475A3E|nr:receptor-type tyrosine-protein phosphatase T-like isoform X2 [Mytilus californianus]
MFGQTLPKTTRVWWTKLHNGRFDIFPESDEKKYYGGAFKNLSLEIINATKSDSGEYRCNGQNTNGQNFVATQLMIGNIPRPPKMERSIYTVREGMNVTLSCTPGVSTTNITSIWWEKKWVNTQFVFIGHNMNKYSGGNLSIPNLTIKKVYQQDQAVYRCNVANMFGTSYMDTEVVIGSPPSVSVPKRNYQTVRGSPIKLDCYFDNADKVWWKRVKNGQEQPVDTARTSGELTKSLIIQNVEKQDDGEYRCYGSNDIEKASGTITISSGYPPAVNISQECYVLRVGDNVTINVIVKNAPPGSTINWRQGRNNIYKSHRQTIGELRNPFLIIRNVELKDAGNYTLFVQNTYGSHSNFTVLTVISATINGNKGYRKLTKTANDSVTIECKVSGGSRVIWRQNGKKLEGANQLSLQINNINRLHKGNYTCETRLETVTAKSSKLQLDVKDIPLVFTTRKKFEVNKGVDAVLPCSHDSYPTPKNVYWIRNGVNISAYSSMKYNGSTIGSPALVIYETAESDSGTYVCSVSNSIGTGYSKPLQLLIREPEKLTSSAGAVTGGVVAIVVIIAGIAVFIWRRRLSSYVKNRKPKFGTRKRNRDTVTMHQGRDDSGDGLHLNLRTMSSIAANGDELFTKPVVTADVECHNVSDVTRTCIRVEDLKKYIQKRQRHGELEDEYKSIPNVAEHPTTHALSKGNMPKNRFKTTLPYDHTRVILQSGGGSDYINANYIDGFEKERCYIACQGPIKTTVGDHWKMIWQENIYQIVMLTNLVDGIKNKCEQYWPAGDKQMVQGNLILRLNVEKKRTAYVTREITIEEKKSGKKRKVTQYHFAAWPDHGTPDPLYLVLFHRHVISDTKAGHSGPLLVHCSAGIGRTGTYIALDALLDEGRTTKFLDIFKFLKKMRYSRMKMIQTSDQYVCLHYALLEAFTMKETKIRKDMFSEVWQSILTDHRPLNHQRLNKEFKMLNATKDDNNQNQYNAAMSTTNLAKNRNKDVLPMDDKRVFLVSHGKERSDYINAVQVPSYTKFVGYITTQLPLPDTTVDFWTMIRDHSSSTIVLIINNKKEADLVYSQSGDTFTIGQFSIKISTREEGENDITKATMVLYKKNDKPRQVVLLQVVCNKIPDPVALCKLADLISTRVAMSNDPVTVVSSDGAKNCGLFCAFTNAVSSMQIDNNADIFQLVRLLQLRRPGFFTDFEEYKRCYEALHVHLESANVYANF